MNIKLFYIIVLSIISFPTVFGQPIEVANFDFSASVWDSSTKTLQVKRSENSTFASTVRIIRTNLPEWTHSGLAFNVEIAAFAVDNYSQQSVKISDDIHFSTSDFTGSTSTSIFKYPT